MAVLLIFFPFIMLSLWARRAIVSSWRESIVLALSVCGLWVWFTTELLSRFNSITLLAVTGIWGLLGLIAGIALCCEQKPFPVIRISWIRFSWVEKTIIGFLVVILVATLVNALNSPPNTWDALTYHMSRVAHWVQNRSVEFYPTHITRQLYSNPWLEYSILQFQVLSGGDHWASMVQWFCMVGSLVTVSLIARQLGLPRCSQWLAALVAATVPIGIVESTSVQGDYAAAFWLCCSLFAFLNFQQTRYRVWVLVCGVSLGSACLSKGTAIVFSVPIVFWIFLDAFQPFAWKKIVQAILVLLILLSINSLFIERNMVLFNQKILGPVTEPKVSLINGTIDYQAFTANLLRNVGVHLGTPSEKLNHCIENSVQGFANTLHVDLNDPPATFLNFGFHIGKPSRNEDTAPSPFHLGLYLFIVILLLIRRKLYMRSIPYLFCILTMVFLFFLLVRWQPWIVRFQLPLLILFAPLCAVAFEENLKSKRSIAVIALLFILSLPYAFNASPRHLVGPKSFFHKTRIQRYFLENSGFSYPYSEAVDQVLKDGCQNVGLVLGGDSWEYPIWALLAQDHSWHGRIEHVRVDNLTKGIRYPLGIFDPCKVIAVGSVGDMFYLGSNKYIMTRIFWGKSGRVYVFSKNGNLNN